MINYILNNLDTIGTLISASAAILTAVATFFLWRVTRLLANETMRMVDAAEQPHVVVTLEPNMWAVNYFDINVSNTGNAPAYDIQINFDPPLVNAPHRKTDNPIPFKKISILKNGQALTSNLCEYKQIKDEIFIVHISWLKKPNTTKREINEYTYDMASFAGISYLGAKNPMTQIADQVKKFRDDWKPITQGSKKIKADVYNSDDRNEERRVNEERYQQQLKEWEERKSKKADK